MMDRKGKECGRHSVPIRVLEVLQGETGVGILVLQQQHALVLGRLGPLVQHLHQTDRSENTVDKYGAFSHLKKINRKRK